jgi:hypothetical protein
MFIVVGLSGIAIVGFLFIPGWIFLRKHLLPMPAKTLPPSGAAPWKRTRTDDLQQQENMSGSFAPIPNRFHAMPTFPNVSSVNQQPAPHANNPTPTNWPTSNSAPGIDPFAGISHSIASSSPTIRKRLARNALRATKLPPPKT